jgi:TIGR03009 family protein
MRVLFCLSTLFAAAALALAQQPQQPTAQAQDAQLDAVLAGWEKALLSLQSLYAECERTTVDKVFQTTEVYKGSAKYLKAPGPGQGSRASLELYKVTPKGLSPTIFEKYVCTGTFLYEYSPANQVIRVHDLPKPKAGQIADDNFLSFLFGMKAVEAKQRYQLGLTPSDQYYHYIKIEPKLPQDKADFTVAQLVIRRDNFLPARVWFHQPNGNQTTWSFPQVRRDIPIPATTFESPKLPQGWKMERVTGDAKAKVRGTGP